MKLVPAIVLPALFVFSCAADQKTQPEDASSAEHEAMAAEEERAAGAHEAEATNAGEEQASPAKNSLQCGRSGCWTSATQPSAQHLEDAKHHRQLAAQHRAASAALLAAEQRACADISEDDRDISPFYHREEITSVALVEEQIQSGKPTGKKTTGAKIEFRAVQGMTAEWLQRVVDCHSARAAAMGHQMPEMDYCPLVLKGAESKVVSTGNGFAIQVTSSDPTTVKEIVARAEKLRP